MHIGFLWIAVRGLFRTAFRTGVYEQLQWHGSLQREWSVPRKGRGLRMLPRLDRRRLFHGGCALSSRNVSDGSWHFFRMELHSLPCGYLSDRVRSHLVRQLQHLRPWDVPKWSRHGGRQQLQCLRVWKLPDRVRCHLTRWLHLMRRWELSDGPWHGVRKELLTLRGWQVSDWSRPGGRGCLRPVWDWDVPNW